MTTQIRIKKKIITQAHELGFNLVGFSPARIPPKHLTAFQNWLDQKYEGNMAYMQKIDQRKNIQKILPGTKTVISLATNYYYEQTPLKKNHGRVARYAFGRDYHKIIKKRLKKLTAFISELAPDSESKAYVDTGPLLERALAEESNIGTIGKNACLITPEYGSWVFLSEILTTLEIEPDTRFHNRKDFSACGGCTRCIDACPTGAIVAPGVIDSRRCLSYLTIEHRDEIPDHLQKAIAITKRIYGCDICQEVCPHNQKNQKPTNDPEFTSPKIAGDQISAQELLALKNDDGYLARFAGSATMRPKLKGFQRNARALNYSLSKLDS